MSPAIGETPLLGLTSATRSVRDDGDAARLEARFRALFELHASAVYRLCARRTGELDLAQDLTSITFLEAWRMRDRLPADEATLPWLLGVAINVTRNANRSRRRYSSALARLPAPAHEPDLADRVTDRSAAAANLRRASDAVNRLPEVERDVLVLVCWEQLTYEQTALALDVAVGTVRSRLARARRRLASLRPDLEIKP